MRAAAASLPRARRLKSFLEQGLNCRCASFQACVQRPRPKRARGAHDIMRPSELISRLLRADYFPLVPKLLPTPVTKSYPGLQLKLPAVPETMSRKSLVPIFE